MRVVLFVGMPCHISRYDICLSAILRGTVCSSHLGKARLLGTDLSPVGDTCDDLEEKLKAWC